MQSLSIAEAQEITFDTSAVPDIHAYLAGLRAHGPIARSKMGVVFALRHQHLELITRHMPTSCSCPSGKLLSPWMARKSS